MFENVQKIRKTRKQINLFLSKVEAFKQKHDELKVNNQTAASNNSAVSNLLQEAKLLNQTYITLEEVDNAKARAFDEILEMVETREITTVYEFNKFYQDTSQVIRRFKEDN
ncbi:hypothetical protein M3C31_00230 [Staphylococcus hominis]|uniref:hypothetical protein n=1 Tax=Staphylococcus hominis TaxID=1290 RepID=UPI0021A4E86C|nr:hypothetical protein [Staphylococcus hominis]MCT1482273.1 hypothetical protein [Staphylococcus hominis]